MFDPSINNSDRISLARNTLYALIKAGVYGNNGLNRNLLYKIYQAYVIPRLLLNYLNKSQLNQLHCTTTNHICRT